MKPEHNCPLCKENPQEQTLFHNKLRYGHPGYIYKCKGCHFIYLWPRQNREDLAIYYKENYRNDYQDAPVEIRYQSDLLEADIRLKRLQIPNGQLNKQGSLLEIGSGSGAFLALASQYFSKTVGVELDSDSRDFIQNKGLEIFESIEKIPPKYKFDYIVMFHVLEHVLDPINVINNLKQFLSPTGSMFIEVPNVDDSLVSLYEIEEFKDFYFCSAHLSYFSEKTLTYCFEAANLNANITQIQRYNLANHINWLMERKPGGLSESKNIFSESTFKAYEEDLKKKGSADTLWAIFESKPEETISE